MIKNLIVLIVDDDEDDRQMFCEVISEMGNSITCLSAQNGQEAVQLLEQGNEYPDFIFLDLNMPRMSGKQFLANIKKTEEFSTIPVIIYSTSNLEADKQETKNLGAEHFISKPSSGKQLKKELESVFTQQYKKATSK